MPIARIGIVGVGPRGLTLLERIVANERVNKSANLDLYLFDSNPPGVGTHDPEQDDRFLVNTVAGQITQFSDATLRAAGPILEGPTFYDWLVDERLSELGDRRGDQPISSDGYYSRALFGRYLHWVYHYLVGLAPAHVNITLIREAVTHTHRVNNRSWSLATAIGSFDIDYLFLTTGHTKAAPRASSHPRASETVVVDDPYPIRDKLAFIGAGTTIAIEGMGLTMFDVLAELTVGRGGKFVDGPSGTKRYVASGREPRLVAYSRSGLPLTARARNQKGVSVQYAARFLLADRIRALRETRKLDFVADVFPLLLADMQYAYYEAYLRTSRDLAAAAAFCTRFSCADALEREALIEQFIPAQDRFSWERLVDPIPASALVTPDAFQAWLMDHLQQDQIEAKKGNVDGPLKAASDVVRDLRDNLRAAIDFGGLTEESHRWVLSDFAPVMNRIAVGPPMSRIAELLALVEASVLDLGFGPGARCQHPQPGEPMRVVSAQWPERQVAVDALIAARVSMHSPSEDASPLLRGLLAAGHVRPYRNGTFHPGGIEVCRNFHWVSEHGSCIENAWSLGIPTEGVKWYTFVVPRSGVNSTALVDAGRAVTKMLSTIKSRATRRSGQLGELSFVPSAEHATAFASHDGALA